MEPYLEKPAADQYPGYPDLSAPAYPTPYQPPAPQQLAAAGPPPPVQMPPPQQPQPNINVEVNQSQSQKVVMQGAGSHKPKPLTVAIIMTVISCCCGFWPLACSLTGLGLALAASSADEETGKIYDKVSTWCSMGAITAIGVQVGTIILSVVFITY